MTNDLNDCQDESCPHCDGKRYIRDGAGNYQICDCAGIWPNETAAHASGFALGYRAHVEITTARIARLKAENEEAKEMLSKVTTACKGNLSLGTGCAQCKRCGQEWAEMMETGWRIISPMIEIMDITTALKFDRLKAENEEAMEMLSKVTTFTLQHRGKYAGEPTETIMVERRGGCRWSISNGLEVLNAEGEWEHEPSPSSRTDEFKDRTRFSLDEAFVRARAFIKEKTDE